MQLRGGCAFLILGDGGADGGGWMRRGCGGIWAEGAGGIKSSARGWGEALAGEDGGLRMPVYVVHQVSMRFVDAFINALSI